MKASNVLLWVCVVLLAACVAVLGVRAEQLAVRPLDSTQTIVVRYIDASGTVVLAPDTMPLWRYVEVQRGGPDYELREAIEADLHAGDATWHRTHEVIDGKEW